MALEITVLSLDFNNEAPPIKKLFHKSEITVGRHPSNDLVVNDDQISGRHLRLRYAEGETEGSSRLFVTDLGSTNGTCIEGVPAIPNVETEFRPGCRISFAAYLLHGKVVSDVVRADFSSGSGQKVQRDTRPIRRNSNVSLLELIRASQGEEVIEEEPASEEDWFAELAEKQESSSIILPHTRLDDQQVEQEELTAANCEDIPEPVESLQQVEQEEIEESKSARRSRRVRLSSEDPLSIQPEDNMASEKKVPSSSGIVELHFEALELFSLQGVVRRGGKGIEGARIDAGEIGTTITDERGKFFFGDLVEGTSFQISATLDGYEIDCSPTIGEVTTDVVLQLEARKYVTVSGQITHRGKPLKGAEVDGGSIGQTKTDKNGWYRFENVLEQEHYSLVASKDGYRISAQQQNPDLTSSQDEDEEFLDSKIATNQAG